MAFTYYYVDPASGGGGNGSSWDLAGGNAAFTWAEFTAFWNASLAAGMIFYVKATSDDSAISMTADLNNAADGTAQEPVVICGVKYGTTNTGAAVNEDDFPTGNKRPYLDDGGSRYGIGSAATDYLVVMNLRIDNSDVYPIGLRSAGWTRNCYVNQEYSGESSVYGIYGTTYSTVIDCEITGAEISGAIVVGSVGNAIFNYIHDITEAGGIGISLNGGYTGAILFNVIDACPIGLDKTADSGGVIFGNTFYDCDEALKSTTDVGTAIINNIFSESDTRAVYWSTAEVISLMMCNHFYNNADDYSGHPEEGDAFDLLCDFLQTGGDPKFTTAGSDFSLQGDSPCINAGMAMRLGVG